MAEEPDPAKMREQAQKAQADGNFKDAYEGFRKLCLNSENDTAEVANDLDRGIQCLRALGRISDIDEFRDEAIKAHEKNWQLLQRAASTLLNGDHQGFIVGGKFSRGYQRQGGQYVATFQRDRVYALQLLLRAVPLSKQEPDPAKTTSIYADLANALISNRYGRMAWRLQSLTDLSKLPDWEDWQFEPQQPSAGAPVDAEGKPVFYSVPQDWDSAKSDGERWRWALLMAEETDAQRGAEFRLQFADFLHDQFGVQTMAEYGWFFRTEGPDQKDRPQTYALDTLTEDETLAKLATGIKRFPLPDEFNYIKIYRSIADTAMGTSGEQAFWRLHTIFVDRRQYTTAADVLQAAIRKHGAGNGERQRLLNQIVKPWCRLEGRADQPAGLGTELDLVFRNGKQVEFEAWQIKVTDLFADIKAYLQSNPTQLDWQKSHIEAIGQRLIYENDLKYLGARVAQWSLNLDPRPNHFDRRINVTTPVQQAGAYLITAKMDGGNVSRVIVWIADTAIVKKPLDQKSWYFVADAVTGQPLAKANVEFFGWRQQQIGRTNKFRVDTKNFAEFTDEAGQIILGQDRLPHDFQWIAVARPWNQGRLAYLGFNGVWYSPRHDTQYHETKVFVITDRPVYRPEQTVKVKFWAREAKYDLPENAKFGGRDLEVIIYKPQGEEMLRKAVKTDEYGGVETELMLPKDAQLGQYSIQITNQKDIHGNGYFRVEEYKKPEFEVVVSAPTKPVQLGEKITATIEAKYYFGAPVTSAKVRYKVLRTTHSEHWYPAARWDWLYGRGYWWTAYDYTWYPGFRRWGCFKPVPIWWHRPSDPPELVAEVEVPIGQDGKVQVEIDTALAKAMHPDDDQQYSIQAEVVDESRRTIVGTGNVMVAREPFRVYVWLNRGYYRPGEAILANFSAHTIAQKPVTGAGKLQLLKIQYNAEGQPQETVAQTWDLATDVEGRSQQQFQVPEAGQYRLSYTVTDDAGHAQEGGYIFVVRGPQVEGGNYRFEAVEIVPDKQEYAAGDQAQLLINTERLNSTVAVFVRPANGVYLAPQIYKLNGKSRQILLNIEKRDMPNFFVEALTVSDGEVHTELRELVVPPESRVLNVEVLPSKTEYLPGAEATVQVKVTDLDKQPFQGTAVLTMYDRAVEYISGGSNVPDIKEFFWKWRRSHYPQTEDSLHHGFHLLLRKGESLMESLGVFGASVADDELADVTIFNRNGVKRGRSGGFARGMGGMGGFGGGGLMAPGAMPAPAEDAAPAAEMRMQMSAVKMKSDSLDQTAAPSVEPTVRSNFADTAFWTGALTTDGDGVASVSLTMPENLTGWKIRTWAMGAGTKVGEGEVEVTTKKNVLVRLQAPRFFVEKDEVVLSANVHNYLAEAKQMQVVLESGNQNIMALGSDAKPLENDGWSLTTTVEVPANGEKRVDWRVKVQAFGEAVITMKALSDVESDAMQMKFPVYVHGMLKTESYAGSIRPDEEGGQLTVNVPEERRPDESRLEIRYSPTLAGAMVDALPYLASYPYGCTEQTLNRFLPTVITQRILQRMDLNLAAIRDKRANLNAQEIGNAQERAQRWKRYDHNPVFDQGEVNDMVRDGVQALTEMQLRDGGWGWFSGFGEHSWPHTTATVVHGLQVAQANDVAIVPDVLQRGVDWLKRHQDEQVQLLKNAEKKAEGTRWKERADNLDALIYMVLGDADIADAEMREFLYRDRTHLSVYGKAVFGLALHKQGQQEQLTMILQNIDQFLVQDDENQTAYLTLPQGYSWWYWHGDVIEANAYYLKLLSRTEPQGVKAPRLVKYLLNNRKHATYWSSTRDTALCIEALAEFLVASGEDKPDLTLEVWIDGEKKKEVQIAADNLFQFDDSLVLTGEEVTTGEHKIELKKKGRGPIYYNAYLTNFTLEDFITKAGLEVKVTRQYYKLVREEKSTEVAGAGGQAVGQRVEKYRREELPNLAELKSGDLVEVELIIDSKNDYEYLLFEDKKPAGFEAVDVRSGYTSRGLGAYTEYRDERVCFFVRQMPQGHYSVTYRMRAEIPGKFSALPTQASAMYAPELKGNSDEIKLIVED